MTFRLILFLAIILVFGVACEKENSFAGEFEREWRACTQANELPDEQAVYSRLTGEWSMFATGCGECASPGVKLINRNVKILFTADSTIRVFEDEQLVRNSKFEIASRSGAKGQTYSVQTSPVLDNLYTWGIIEFCKDRVVFRTSYMDGPDYYFQRIPE